MNENKIWWSQLKENAFVIIETILSIVIVYSSVIKRDDITSDAFTFSFVSLLVMFMIILLRKNIDKYFVLLIFIVIISIINVLITSFIANVQINFYYLQSLFIFLSTLIFYTISQNYKINKVTENFIYISQIVIALAYPYCYNFVEMKTNHTYNIAFNFSNPNLAGMFIFLTILYMILGIIRYKKIWIKLIFLILAVVNFNYMQETGSRNALLALIVFLVLIGISYIKKTNLYKNWMLAFFSYLPSLFVPVYLLYINVVIKKGWFSSLVSEGKNLNSREEIWRQFFSKLGDKWLVGNYPSARGNAHNSHMVVLCSFGLIVLVMVIILTYKILENTNKKCKTFYTFCCMIAFIASLLIGIGEGALFSGGQGIYILAGSFLFLVNVEQDNAENDNAEKRHYFEI